MPEREENKAFRLWTGAEGEDKLQLEAQLAYLCQLHARAVVVKYFGRAREDLIQDILEKSFRKLSSFKGNSLFSTWFHAVALNACRDAGWEDSRRKEQQLEDSDAVEDSDAILARVELGELMGGLRPRDQEFVRDKLAQMQEQELAVKWKLTVEGVRSRWSRIKRKLTAS